MTYAKLIADTLRELAPGKQLVGAEIQHGDAIAALWAARAPAQPKTGGWATVEGQGAPARSTGLKDDAAFYAALRSSSGPFKGGLSDQQVQGVQALLAAMGFAAWPLSFAAYGFATPWLETGHTMQPIKEYGGPAYFTRMYDINGQRPAKARELGNLSPGDGAKYAGRGYVQLTGKSNYKRAGDKIGVDLTGSPDLAMEPGNAARIMVEGMVAGWFTTKKLSDYLPAAGPADHAAFVQARRIINGQDRAAEIANVAAQFQAALLAGGWK